MKIKFFSVGKKELSYRVEQDNKNGLFPIKVRKQIVGFRIFVNFFGIYAWGISVLF